ncbi:hypothetical protein MA16_Dca005639 [Dendrobium catenatum]|uniref:DUF4283 domain-containing protein n=1 Tax=Dendrobium catenatum TaxID=906689 RepID=A0A2I0WQ65_9ASPA|nr:hypothetical protein MA16_Dca005639 [Dendrobium catenatum]
MMHETDLVLGKGKKVIKSQDKKDLSGLSSPISNLLTEMANDKEVWSSIGFKLKVNRFSSVADNGAEFQDRLNLNSEKVIQDNVLSVDEELQRKSDGFAKKVLEDKVLSAVPYVDKNNFVSENYWFKTSHIKVNKVEIAHDEEGDANVVNLNMEKVSDNVKLLQKSLVLIVFGKEVPFSICRIELRRQWNRFGSFHLTSLGLDWILCSFQSSQIMEEVLSGGPWFVGGHIIGVDRWTPHFSPTSLKGLSSPIWIGLPHLPLHCWDEENATKIVSKIGIPLFLDGKMFKWGRREFARACVRINLDSKLPNGIWIEGLFGKFFQKV